MMARRQIEIVLAIVVLVGLGLTAVLATRRSPTPARRVVAISSRPQNTASANAVPTGLKGTHMSVAAPTLALHFDNGTGLLLGSRRADLHTAGQSFNAVIVAAGNPKLVQIAHAEGFQVYLGFDQHTVYAHGYSITNAVNRVVRQIQAQRSMIVGVRIGDRINVGLTPAQVLGYLRATGGILHEQAPGIKVFADVVDWQLTCGMAGQRACTARRVAGYQYADNAELLSMMHSGNLDGFMLANNLAGGTKYPQVQTAAWKSARALFPHPFLLWERAANLSFATPTFERSLATAQALVHVEEQIPLQEGADGVDLWAWHVGFKGTLRTFLNKNGTSNVLWQQMAAFAGREHAQAS